MHIRNRLWKATKQKKNSLTRCSDVTLLNPDGSVKDVIPINKLPEFKPRQYIPEQIDPLDDNPRRSPAYAAWRQKIIDRDNNTCVLCGLNKWIQVHHISRYVDDEQGRLDINNGVCLCVTCHQKHHGPYQAAFPIEITRILLNYIASLGEIK